MNISWKRLMLAGSLITIAGCSNNEEGENAEQSRWYTQEQVIRGSILYKTNCAQCHQTDASGHANKKQDFTAPALNGTEHAWHHPLTALRHTIKNGGKRLGGTMPGFKDKLSNKEIDDVIAYFQSYWPDKIYTLWDKRNKRNLKNK